MAKKDELEFEGGIDNPSKPNNSEKLKALQAAMDKIEKTEGTAGCHGQDRKELRKRFNHENG